MAANSPTLLAALDKWCDESFHALQRFFKTDVSQDVMLSRIKDMAQKLPPLIGQIVRFGTLVGLRAAKLLECVKLIKNNQTFQNINSKMTA
jgi:hypothetical protein